MAADGYIGAVPHLPVLTDPHVAGTWGNGSDDLMPCRMDRNINLLRGSGVGEGTHADHQDSEKCQFYNFFLHMLVFKFRDWIILFLES